MILVRPRLKTALALTAIAAMMVVGHQSPARAESVSTPIDFVEPHECTLETVVMDGRLHIVTQVNTNPDGTVNLIVHRDLHGTNSGTGQPSGDKYMYNEDSTVHSKESVDSTSIQSFVFHTQFIHAGEYGGWQEPALDDLHAKVRVIVVLKNGVPTNNVFIDERTCR